MSDNTAVWRALNGLAAWFSSSGGLIQNASLFGSLVLLALALFRAASHTSALSQAQLGTWFFFMCGMGMTGQANVYNIYTNQVTVVQNVPALALIPASMFSKAAYRIFTNMETAFQSTTGSYMSVSQNGFVGPLDILLTLRSPKLADSVPALSQSLAQVVHDCTVDPQASGTVPPISQAKDIIDWLYQYGRQAGMTKIYSETDASHTGTMMSCVDGVNYLNTAYTAMAGGSAELLKAVNSISKTKNPQDANKGLWAQPAISNSFDMVIGAAIGMQQSSVQFTKNALVASIVTNTIDCMNQTGFATTPDTCAVAGTAMGDGMSQWETQTAMAGTGFLKTMFTSMGFLQILFFSLFPFIAIYGLIVVNNTPKIFGSYILFGIWSQSWLLVVAPIQSYIQTSVIDEMTKITAGSGGMTLANTAQVYTALATKLAVASDLMANSQMLSLALLSGSMVALSGLVGKWSGSQHMDSSNLQNKLSDSAALVKNNPMNVVDAISHQNGDVTQHRAQYGAGSATLMTTLNSTGSSSFGKNETFTKTMTRGNEIAASVKAQTGYQLSDEEAFNYAAASGEVHGANAKISTALVSDVIGALALKGNKQAAAAVAAKNEKGVADKISNGGGNAPSLKGLDASYTGQTSDSHQTNTTIGAKKGTTQSGSTDVSNSDKLNNSIAAAEQTSHGYTATKSAINGIQMSLEPAQIMRMGIEGVNGMPPQQLINNASSTLDAMKRSGNYDSDQIQLADERADNAMMGRTLSDPKLQKFQHDLYAQHFLSNGHISGLFKNSTGLAQGAGSLMSNFNANGKEAQDQTPPSSVVPSGGIGAHLVTPQFKDLTRVVTHAKTSYENMVGGLPSAQVRVESTADGANAMEVHDRDVLNTKVGITVAAGVALVGNAGLGVLSKFTGGGSSEEVLQAGPVSSPSAPTSNSSASVPPVVTPASPSSTSITVPTRAQAAQMRTKAVRQERR